MSRKTGQDKAHAILRHQPILLALGHIFVAYLLTWLIPLPVAATPFLQTVGFMLVIAGFMLGLGALLTFRRSRITSDLTGATPQLVTSGIYRFTRNPVYLGFAFMLGGLPLNAGSYWGIVLLPLMVILFNRWIIEQEENHLMQIFGDRFRSYKSKVRRWI